ncbi:uncharacterized protein F5Z01DRAFT_688874 [Emericellopsis atlantica]|uniref:Uncharacterized protein n=1 Tax=Emericellopsis atlantica TaxID=2614577 RepID=A0A9P8CN41_9HYPO|nr:uncharacterized protein F5Z01DRAFT_688874 [Emericellopsis atlantica]KAG9253379.1 hypothetical protein F5Z01DRAFT_688874 [Emericellopsis atlantica]
MAFFLPPTSQGPPKSPETPPKTDILDLKPLPQLPSADSNRASDNERNAAHRSSSLGKWWKSLRPSRRPEKGSTYREASFQDDSEITPTHLHRQATGGHRTRRGGTTDSGHILEWNVPTVIHDPPKDTPPPPRRVVSARGVADSSDLDERRFSFAPKSQVPEQLSLGKQTWPDKKVAFQELPHESEPTDESKMQASYLADRRLSLTRRAIEAKKELRRQRKNLKESSDFLGVQGFNPRTGTEDSLTSSSTANSEGSGDVTNEKVNAFRQAKRSILNNRKEAQAQQKSKHVASRPNKGVTWRRHTNEWSSIQDPGVSPVTQSPRSDPNDSHRMSLDIDKTAQTSPQLPIMKQDYTPIKLPPPLLDLGSPSSATETKMMPCTTEPEPTSEVGSHSSSILIHNRPRRSSGRTLYAGELYKNDDDFHQPEDLVSDFGVYRGDLSANTGRGGIEDFDEEAKMEKPTASYSFLGTGPVSKSKIHQSSDTGFLPRHQPMAETLQLTHGTPKRSLSLLPAEVGSRQPWMREKENIWTLHSDHGITNGTMREPQCQEESVLRMPVSTPTIITTGSERKVNGISQKSSLNRVTEGLEEKGTTCLPATLAASFAVAQSLPVLSSHKSNSPLSSTPEKPMTRSDTVFASGKRYPSKRFVRRRSVANAPDLRRVRGSVLLNGPSL